jgi:redox-sensitive bicupin YhaK (pirin superfamily)
MSWTPCPDPTAGDRASADAIETLIIPRAVDLGEMVVRRALPSVKRQMVGPFIFFDQMGPAEFLTDQGIDVRPHPHINLATVTFLFEGQILHRDSLGTEKTIEPGAVNWMRAGRGIVHSERTSDERKHSGQRLFGIQSWMALPEAQEESDPAFVHHGAQELPVVGGDSIRARVIAGELLGVRSPLITPSETIYAHLNLRAGARMPIEPSFEERAVYTLNGEIEIAGDRFGPTPDPAAGRSDRGHGDKRRRVHALRRRADGWASLHLVELRFIPYRAYRASEGGMGSGPLRHCPRRRRGVHPAAADEG